MWRLLLISACRFHLRQPWQLGLTLAGIGLGVAAFVSIQSANRTAKHAFELSAGTVRGRVTHRIIPAGTTLPASLYTDVVRSGYANRAAPIIALGGDVGEDGNRRAIELVGVDPIEELGLGRYFPASDDAADVFLRLVAEPHSALASPALAALGTSPGDRVTVAVDGQTIVLSVIGSFAGPTADTPALVTDIAVLQALMPDGALSRIDLALDDDDIASLRGMLGSGTALVDETSRNNELAAMTRAFTTNLTALGLLALVVGVFLIHATMSFAVVRRRAQIATLRSLGLGRHELVGMLAIEAVMIGTVAGTVGAIGGYVLSDWLIDLVLRTMSDLAFSRTLADRAMPWWPYPTGIGIGIATALVAIIRPAREAARLAPASIGRRSMLEAASRQAGRRLAMLSLPTLGIAAILLVAWPRSLGLGFAALFLVLIAGAMCVPAATVLLMRMLESPARKLGGLPAVLAVRGVVASLSRTGIATAALTIAVATVISIGLMVGSFKDSLMTWIDETLTADYYLLLDASGGTPDADGTTDDWAGSIAALPGVSGISRTRRVTVPGMSGRIEIRATEPGPDGWGLDLAPGFAADWERQLRDGNGVVLAEPYAYRHNISTGDRLSIMSPSGSVELPVLGLYRDYNTAGSAAILSLTKYRAYWSDTTLSGIGVHITEDADPDRIVTAIEATRPAGIRSATRSTTAIRDISLTLFDRTFEITGVLRTLAGIVAFLGMLSSILALQLERRSEFSILGSIGMSLGQLRAHVVVQTMLLGLSAALAAIPVGCVLAWLLIFVINRRAFGWTMDFVPALPPLAYGIVVALAAATACGLAASFLSLRRNTEVTQLAG